jgi:hypothetical protein
MTKSIDITRIGAEPEVCESVVEIPEIEVRVSFHTHYGIVYPRCKHSTYDEWHDSDGDFVCDAQGRTRHCGCTITERCPMHYNHDTAIWPHGGITYAEYVSIFETTQR